MNRLDDLKEKLQEFNRERDWDQFHSPKNIAMALSVEASEIVEIFQWMQEEQSYDLERDEKEKLEEELGDVFLYLQLLASKYDIDLLEVARKKLAKNKKKYPVNKAKGSSKKYAEL
ncbi:NTP pyrophosphatase, house-cleaning of non-canonical NTPs [Fodinibius roseus]|uniref:NTP pyrophosphatase, house-cleaning of non-canonical NTPs n=1 Tax=Fodinibius roseus TaxID=1194090 RepID=A0A1M4UM71_9BACT|nr:nucleotide pyrophosphohydrolase [Fodinibius roseus]SHE57670.1 NTP pyrophosphatase, house-cleaning of non-canonical NTPs [Fodinibius roseus]